MSDSEDEGVDQHLINMIKEWVALDDEIKDNAVEVKVLKNQKTTIQEQIEEYMLDNKIGSIKINGGKLSMAKSERTKALSMPLMKQVMFDNLGEAKFNELMTLATAAREKVTTTKLKRTADRKKKVA